MKTKMKKSKSKRNRRRRRGVRAMMVMWICLGSMMVMGMRAGGQAAGRHLGPGLEVDITVMGALR